MFRTRREMMRLVAAAPFLAPAFRSVLAEGAAPLKRLVIMQRYNGAPLETWYPKNWDNFTGTCLEPLNDPKLKSKLIVMKGLENKFVSLNADAHTPGARSAWAGRSLSENGLSVDQYVSNKMNFPTARKNIALGAYSQGFDGVTQTFFKAPGSGADINDSPYDAIDKIFANFMPIGPVGPGGDMKATALLAKKKSILDVLTGDLGRMSRSLVGNEKDKLDAHLSFVRSAEQNLAKGMQDTPPPPKSVCAKLGQPSQVLSVHDLAKLPEIARMHIELIAMAMACDISRIFVLQILSSYTNVGGGDVDLPWCGANIGRDAQSGYVDGAGNPVLALHQYHHARNENGAHRYARDVYTRINRTYASLFADLLKKLDAAPDGAGTLLDNSMSVLGSEYGGTDFDGNAHAPTDLPFLVAGGAGGFLKTNQMLDVQGRSHTQLHGSIFEYFGIDDGSGEKTTDFGTRNRGLSFGTLPGIKKV